MKKHSFSIVITTYNRQEKLRQAILSLMRQDYTGRFEVIISDDGSTDGTSSMIRQFPEGKVRYTKNAGRNMGKALNIALGQAENEIIVFMDNDNTAESNFLLEFNQALNDSGSEAVTGRQVPYTDSNIFARYERYMMNYYLARGGYGFPLAVRREALAGFRFLEKDSKDKTTAAPVSKEVYVVAWIKKNKGKIFSTSTSVKHWQDYSLRGFIRSAKSRGIAGRDYAGTSRLWYLMKLCAFPLLFVKYLLDYLDYPDSELTGRDTSHENIEMIVMRTAFNMLSSAYAVIE